MSLPDTYHLPHTEQENGEGVNSPSPWASIASRILESTDPIQREHLQQTLRKSLEEWRLRDAEGLGHVGIGLKPLPLEEASPQPEALCTRRIPDTLPIQNTDDPQD
jgi:hypothetical protein